MITRKNIGYHTRLYSDNTVKVVGGSFGGRIDMETVERLTRLFTVIVKPSGTAVFVDKNGREVRLYLSVDPDTTEIGKQALKDYRLEKERRDNEEREEREELMSQIDDMSSDEIRWLLKISGEKLMETET